MSAGFSSLNEMGQSCVVHHFNQRQDKLLLNLFYRIQKDLLEETEHISFKQVVICVLEVRTYCAAMFYCLLDQRFSPFKSLWTKVEND